VSQATPNTVTKRADDQNIDANAIKDGAIVLIGYGPLLADKIAQLDSSIWIGVVDRPIQESYPKNVHVFRGELKDYPQWVSAFMHESVCDTLYVSLAKPSLMKHGYYSSIVDMTHDAVAQRKTEVHTLLRYAEQLEENSVKNIRSLKEAYGVKDIKGYEGVPGILVGAGPSLDREAISILKKLQNKSALFCVGKVLDQLNRSGVFPHFVGHLDMLAEGLAYFNQVNQTGTTLVYDHDANHKIISQYKGRKVTFDTVVPVSKWIAKETRERGKLDKGMSVMHTGFYFLKALGCNPIVLVGVDLSLPSDTTHAEGSIYTWGGQLDALSEQVTNQMTVAVSTQGKNIKSLKQFDVFRTLLEHEIAKTDVKVINTSQIGARINGATEQSLSEIELKDQKIQPDWRRHGDEGKIDEAILELKRIMNRCIYLCSDGLKKLRQVEAQDPTNPFDRKAGLRRARASQRIYHELVTSPAEELLKRLCSEDSIEIQKLLKDGDRTWLKRMRLYFESHLKSANLYLDWLKCDTIATKDYEAISDPED